MSSRSESSRRQLLIGVLLFALGVGLLGAQWRWWPYERAQIWPVFYLLFLFTDWGRRHAYLVVSYTGIFLLHTTGLVPLSRSWPLFLVVWGVRMVAVEWRGGGPRRCGRARAQAPPIAGAAAGRGANHVE